MTLPLQITFRNLPVSEALSEHVRAKAMKLDTFYARIMGCRVAVEAPYQHHHHQGSHFRVRIDLTVPGAELVVGNLHTRCHGDARSAVDDAFHDAERVLKDHVRQQRASTIGSGRPAAE